jgi:H+/Na+-translocating ferredoxin:NAD+ oxidoreductase subunit C
MAERARLRGPAQQAFDRLYRFHGGLVLAGHRELTVTAPITPADIPPLLVLPLLQHIGEPAEALVKPGDSVRTGEMIARPVGTVSAPVHASGSGTVVAVEPRPVPHPSALPADCIVIETDGRDQWQEPAGGLPDYRSTDPQTLLERIREAGIVGLGGAGFPTRVKLASGKRAIDTLIINGAECEPYITCDQRLMLERATEIIEGVRILQYIVQPEACTVAIEDSMPAAETALRDALEALQETGISVTRIPTIYPAGGERQLIKVLTGSEVPSQGLPADIGIICQNVGTAAAVYRAVCKGTPLLSRIVTVTGSGVLSPRNLEVRIGTPLSHLISACGGYTHDVERLLIGGPMMGYAVNSDAVPVIKTTNCILAVTREEMPAPPPAQPCIRCGKCTEVCPADLLPQQLYWYASSGNYDAAQDYDLFDCIECGCCAYVCPSHIPLVQHYRHAKTEIWAQEKQRRKSDLARQRHEARLARLERVKQERAEKMASKKQALSQDAGGPDPKQAAIQAALERVKRKKEEAGVSPGNTDNLTPEQRQQITAADQRRAAQNNGDRQTD